MRCCIIGCPNQEIQNKDISYHLFPHPTKERYRYAKWIEACNNPRLCEKTSEQIYRQFRICRRHFDDVCFNGACKRLLSNAIPTLYLNKDKRKGLNSMLNESSRMIYERQKRQDFKLSDDDDTIDVDIDVLEPNDRTDDSNDDNVNYDNFDNNDDMTVISNTIHQQIDNQNVNVKYEIYDDELQQNMNGEKNDNTGNKIRCGLDVKGITEDSTNITSISQVRNDNIYDIIEILDDSLIPNGITNADIKNWKEKFFSDAKNILAQNACTKTDPFEVCLTRKALELNSHTFNVKIEAEGKPTTHQKDTGRCWLFAALNCMRLPFSKQMNLDEFEFSQAYLFYWDKIERCHYLLNAIVTASMRGEEINGRLISFLLKNPTNDGGQWDMIFNLIKKYGLMPKKCFPDSHSSEASRRMNQILKSKLREYAKILRDMIEQQESIATVQLKIKEQMMKIYNIVGICLSIPDSRFTWEYYDRNKIYHKIGPITPLEFYENHVKNCFNVDDKVCIINDPRKVNPYDELYTLEYLGNMVGGRPVLYNNQSIDVLLELVIKSIKRNEAVWFGSDVGKRVSTKLSALDTKIHDFELVFGVDIEGPLNKADRLSYGESMMTHAMVITAISCDDNGKPRKFRVENSYGERGEKGYYVMSLEWFKEFVYEIVVDRAIVADSILAIFDKSPIALPPWDPMATLA